jgi:hypothetical protein
METNLPETRVPIIGFVLDLTGGITGRTALAGALTGGSVLPLDRSLPDYLMGPGMSNLNRRRNAGQMES